MLSQNVNRRTIEKMIRQFYSNILKDNIVGPYFIKALGDDLSNDKWDEHFKTLDNFWLMIMTGEKGYMGDPFVAHVFIGQLNLETFQRWLEVFNEVVHEFFIAEIASKFNKKAQMLSKQFIENLEIKS